MQAEINAMATGASQVLSLPLVSVIIINYNYASYLADAVRSVLTQTYPAIECIIVDNASTDKSPSILAELKQTYPELIIIQRSENSGMCAAAVEGFGVSSGQYVIFLDADDLLLEEAVSTHVFVFLSFRLPIGATSGDMLQSVDNEIVLASDMTFFDFSQAGRPELFRRFDESAPQLWPLPSPSAGLDRHIHFVEPLRADWVWAPTSGNCFRRDALRLFLTREGVRGLRGALDNYLLRGISVLTGSVLIDRPLAVYRIHGKNLFSKHPRLHNLFTHEASDEDEVEASRDAVIEHLLRNAPAFIKKMGDPLLFVRALEVLNDSWPRKKPSPERFKAYLARPEASVITEMLGLKAQRGWFERMGGSQTLLKRAGTFAKGLLARAPRQW